MNRRCDFCYRLCSLDDGAIGICGVRQNQGDRVVTLGWGEVVALALDPVEKKPLYHYKPGHHTLSVALFGCNFRCSFCQNYSISQPQYHSARTRGTMEPMEVVALALSHNSPSISFTYSEPMVWQDWMIEVATGAKEAGLATIMVTNGSFSSAALTRLLPLIDAFNVDLKGDEAFYRTVCASHRKPVLDGIEAISRAGNHLEVTTMVIEGVHTPAILDDLAAALVQRKIAVWHLSRYVPHYHGPEAATGEAYVRQSCERAHANGITHVYAGNCRFDRTTYCPVCARPLIGRSDAAISSTLVDGVCPGCGHRLYGHFPP